MAVYRAMSIRVDLFDRWEYAVQAMTTPPGMNGRNAAVVWSDQPRVDMDSQQSSKKHSLNASETKVTPNSPR